MTLPAFLFGLLIASLLGAAFHLWRDGGLLRLFLYLALAWTGFWAGQYLANLTGWTFASLGSLHLGLAIVTSLLFLLTGHWLSLVEVERR